MDQCQVRTHHEVAIALGVTTYYVWYRTEIGQVQGTGVAAGSSFVVRMSNFSYDPREMKIPVGATVELENLNGKHSVIIEDGSFTSIPTFKGGRFSHQFTKPGRFSYHCGFHGGTHGGGMSGVIVVE